MGLSGSSKKKSRELSYNVDHEDLPLHFLVFTITAVCLLDFYILGYVPMETRKNNLQNRHKIYNFTLTMSSVVAMVSAVRDDRGRPLPAVCSTDLVFAESRPTFFLFRFLCGYLLISIRAEIPQVLISILFSGLNMLPYYIPVHY